MKLFAAIKFVALFYKGLERNFKIINYGRVPEIYVTEKAAEKYPFAQGFRSIGAVVKNLRRELLTGAVRSFNYPSAPAIFCGASANNEREFKFLSEAMSSAVPSLTYERENNISFVELGRAKRSSRAQVIFVLVFILSVVYALRIKICPTSYKYLVSYARIFGWVYLSSVDRAGAVKLAVVANDHTDFPVAFSMVMQLLGVRTLYVQHAEVTEKFPALDFDYSILRNERSRRIYEKIAPTHKDIFIIPRVFELPNLHKLLDRPPANAHVVIYLSSVFDGAQVCKCVDALGNNPKIISVSIKRHPRVPAENIHSVVNVAVLDAVPAHEHIALVPNSSVAVELLEAGVRVYQYFPLDNVPPDYYGFVRDGVTRELSGDDLRSDFWCDDFYNKNWLSRFKMYSPAVDGEWRSVLLEAQDKIGALLRD